MPRGSGKGRLSGGKRIEINQRRATDIVSGKIAGNVFARITKIVGAGHAKAAIEGKHGPKELLVRIPNLLGRRGATPITPSSVVSIYVGEDFTPDTDIKVEDHFEITSILDAKQAYKLQKDGVIPLWMAQDVAKGEELKTDVEPGFEFDYSGPGDEEGAAGGAGEEVPGFSRKAAKNSVHHVSDEEHEGELNVDDI